MIHGACYIRKSFLQQIKAVREFGLPPCGLMVLPLYNGEKPWSAPSTLAQLIEPAEGLEQPSFQYVVLDASHHPVDELRPVKDVISGVFLMKQVEHFADLEMILDELEGLVEDRESEEDFSFLLSEAKMNVPRFTLLGVDHLATLVVIVLVGGALILSAKRWPRLTQPLGFSLGLFMVIHEIYQIILCVFYYEQPLKEHLPLQLCNAVVILVALVFFFGGARLYEVAYFWGTGGTIQALITPDLFFGFPHPLYVSYFVSHGLGIVGVLYAAAVLSLRPQSVRRALLYTAAYAFLFVTPINLALNTNYLYLRGKPMNASLIDHLGPWPWYIASLAVVAVLSFCVSYAPFYWLDRRTVSSESLRSKSVVD